MVQAVGESPQPGSLARACLLIARGEYPELDMDACLGRIAALGARVRESSERDGGQPWRTLRTVLGKEERFVGDHDTYDAPENSYLNCVLERRRGLPILLSVVWIETARAAGFPAEGIGLPGHFIARVGDGDQRLLVDPFVGGLPISAQDALLRGAAAAGAPSSPDPAWLEPVSARDLLSRVLNNLANRYQRDEDYERLARVVGDQLALHPGELSLLVRRGEARGMGGDVAGSLEDLNAALPALPPGPLFDRVHAFASSLARRRVSEN